MTLDEAIKHEEEIIEEEQYEYQECVATHNMEGAKNCRKYAEEHRQLAEWLKELREIKNIVDSAEMIIEEEYGVVIVEGYADVFDLIKKRVRLLEE